LHRIAIGKATNRYISDSHILAIQRTYRQFRYLKIVKLVNKDKKIRRHKKLL